MLHRTTLRSLGMSASEDESSHSSQAIHSSLSPAFRLGPVGLDPSGLRHQVRFEVLRGTGWSARAFIRQAGGAGGLQEEDSEGEGTGSEAGGSTAEPGEAEVRDRCS